MKYLMMFLFLGLLLNKTNAQFGSLGSIDARSLGLAGLFKFNFQWSILIKIICKPGNQ